MNEERTGKCIRRMKHIRGHLFHNAQPSHGGDHKTLEVMTSP